jgi:hypothetical protein
VKRYLKTMSLTEQVSVFNFDNIFLTFAIIFCCSQLKGLNARRESLAERCAFINQYSPPEWEDGRPHP